MAARSSSAARRCPRAAASRRFSTSRRAYAPGRTSPSTGCSPSSKRSTGVRQAKAPRSPAISNSSLSSARASARSPREKPSASCWLSACSRRNPCCCWTNPSTASIFARLATSWRSCAPSPRAAAPSSSRFTNWSMPPACATAWCCSAAAASWAWGLGRQHLLAEVALLARVHQGAKRHFAVASDHAQVAVQVAVGEDVAFAEQGVVVLQDVGRAADVLGLAFDFEVVVEQVGLDAQSGFNQPDVFIPGAEEAFDASADADAGFDQVGVGYLQAGENRRQGLPLNWEGFEASTTRWHGLQNTIHDYYTAISQAPGVIGGECGRRLGWGGGGGCRNEANLGRSGLG